MDHIYPVPQELGIKISRHLKKDRYRSGFEHAMQGGQLSQIEYMRLSFREGFRAAKLYLRELRKKQGILDFPMQGKIRMRVA